MDGSLIKNVRGQDHVVAARVDPTRPVAKEPLYPGYPVLSLVPFSSAERLFELIALPHLSAEGSRHQPWQADACTQLQHALVGYHLRRFREALGEGDRRLP